MAEGVHGKGATRPSAGSSAVAVCDSTDLSPDVANDFHLFLLESVSDGVFVYYYDEPDRGKLVYVNEAAHAARGYTREEMLGMNVRRIVSPKLHANLDGWLERLESEGDVRAESIHVRKDGSEFPVEVLLRLVEFDRRLVVTVSRDITERKRVERNLQRELDTTVLLLEAADALSKWTELDKLLDNLVRITLHALPHLRVVVGLLEEDAPTIRILWADGEGTPLRSTGPVAWDDISGLMQNALVNRETRFIDYDAVPESERGLSAGFSMRTSLVVPLVVGDRLLGSISVDQTGKRREFSEREIRLVSGIASQAAVAIENARLYQRQLEAKRYAEGLNHINTAIHSTLSPEEVMQRVVVEVANTLEVEASIIQLHQDGYWESAAVYGLPKAFGYLRLSDEDAPTSVLAAESRHPVVVHDTEHDSRVNAEVMQTIGVSAFMVAPLIVRGEVIGVLFADRIGGDIGFTRAQVDFLEKVAATLALAIQNARLFEAEHRIAETLQTAILSMPTSIPYLSFSFMYRSATETARVGGDFYDLFQLDASTVGITIGDISGHGVDAAVLTSLVKNAIRIQAAQQRMQPDEVMRVANEVLYENSSAELFATALFGLLHLDTGEFEYCNAGHTTAVRVGADGRCDELPANSLLVGAFAESVFELSRTHVDTGDVLFFYTDGLTEARSGNEFFGEERVYELLRPGLNAEEMLQRVVNDVLRFAGGRLSDDVAILVVERC